MLNHAELQDSIPLLALGGLSADEQGQLEQHLLVCPSCRALLAEYDFVAEELNAQVPARAAPAGLESRLMKLAADARPTMPTRTAAPVRPTGWRRPVGVARWAVALAVLAGLVMLGALGVLAWQLQNAGPAPSDSVAALVTSHDLKFLPLVSSSGGTVTEKGIICIVPENSTALLWLYGLERLDYDHAYQVWLSTDGEQISGGVFRPGYDGRAVVVVDAPQPFSDYKEIGISIEPADGSPAPTSPRVIEGDLQ
jgi:anti-sigma-K factor RskA